jgi:hypothetical protein
MDTNGFLKQTFPAGTTFTKYGNCTKTDEWTVNNFKFVLDVSGVTIEELLAAAGGGNGKWITFQNNVLRKCKTLDDAKALSGKVVHWSNAGKRPVDPDALEKQYMSEMAQLAKTDPEALQRNIEALEKMKEAGFGGK